MHRYYLEFSKSGYIRYTSHLDLQRLFKRTFKHLGIPIEYSKGFNPHPRMGFAQPLSLGYSACHEYLEFYTSEPIRLDFISRELKDAMPEGLDILKVDELNIDAKSLASIVTSAVYTIILPLSYRARHEDIEETVKSYLDQDKIIAKKREKKTKKYVDKDIKNQIRSIDVEKIDGRIGLVAKLDSGSSSNLSPEQIISSFQEFSQLYLPREDIDVIRNEIIFDGF